MTFHTTSQNAILALNFVMGMFLVSTDLFKVRYNKIEQKSLLIWDLSQMKLE